MILRRIVKWLTCVALSGTLCACEDDPFESLALDAGPADGAPEPSSFQRDAGDASIDTGTTEQDGGHADAEDTDADTSDAGATVSDGETSETDANASDGNTSDRDADVPDASLTDAGADAGDAGAGEADAEAGCATNKCGGCQVLNSTPGAKCGTCGTYVCSGKDAVACNDPGYAKVIDIAAGGLHTCALLSSGSVYCWGSNGDGELGNGKMEDDQPNVVRVVNLEGAKAISAGELYTCAVLSGGKVRCWGANTYDQLGTDEPGDKLSPVEVAGLSGAETVLASNQNTCTIAAADKSLRCWGASGMGQLGNADADGADCTACQPYHPAPQLIPGLSAVKSVAAGDFHICAVLADSNLRCWGYNTYGQLGAGQTLKYRTSAAASVLSGARAVAIDDSNTCALLETGGVRCWGRCLSGACGDADVENVGSPPSTDFLTGASAITLGEDHGCALLASDGKIACWGDNYYYQLGDDTVYYSDGPLTVPNLKGATAVAAGTQHTCALVSGTVKCWGGNGWHQLGDGTTDSNFDPVLVKGLDKICR